MNKILTFVDNSSIQIGATSRITKCTCGVAIPKNTTHLTFCKRELRTDRVTTRFHRECFLRWFDAFINRKFVEPRNSDE